MRCRETLRVKLLTARGLLPCPLVAVPRRHSKPRLRELRRLMARIRRSRFQCQKRQQYQNCQNCEKFSQFLPFCFSLFLIYLSLLRCALFCIHRNEEGRGARLENNGGMCRRVLERRCAYSSLVHVVSYKEPITNGLECQVPRIGSLGRDKSCLRSPCRATTTCRSRPRRGLRSTCRCLAPSPLHSQSA